jgi:hypothetical protein
MNFSPQDRKRRSCPYSLTPHQSFFTEKSFEMRAFHLNSVAYYSEAIMFTFTTEYKMMASPVPVKEAAVMTPVDEKEILREQLDYLIQHAASLAECGCRVCRRYHRVRNVLLEIFA